MCTWPGKGKRCPHSWLLTSPPPSVRAGHSQNIACLPLIFPVVHRHVLYSYMHTVCYGCHQYSWANKISETLCQEVEIPSQEFEWFVNDCIGLFNAFTNFIWLVISNALFLHCQWISNVIFWSTGTMFKIFYNILCFFPRELGFLFVCFFWWVFVCLFVWLFVFLFFDMILFSLQNFLPGYSSFSIIRTYKQLILSCKCKCDPVAYEEGCKMSWGSQQLKHTKRLLLEPHWRTPPQTYLQESSWKIWRIKLYTHFSIYPLVIDRNIQTMFSSLWKEVGIMSSTLILSLKILLNNFKAQWWRSSS